MGSGASKTKAEEELATKKAGTRSNNVIEETPEFIEMRAAKMRAELKKDVMGKIRTHCYFKNDANFKVYTDLDELMKARKLEDKSDLLGSSQSYLETILVQVMDKIKKTEPLLFEEMQTALVSGDEAQVKAFVDKANWGHYCKVAPKLGIPKVHDMSDWHKRKGAADTAGQQNYGGEYANAIGDAENLLMKGKLCIQIFSGGVTTSFREKLSETGQDPRAMYFLDPWRLVQDGVSTLADGFDEPPDERVDHVTYGQRMMMQIALRLRDVGWKHSKLHKNDKGRESQAAEAVRKAYVILHVNHEVEARVVEDLVSHRFYGFDRNKVIVIPENMMPGCTWHPGRNELMADRNSQMQFYGTGYKMLQLGWSGEGYLVNRKGRRQWLDVSAMDFLNQAGVEWITTSSINDFTQLEDRELAFDFDRLSYTLNLQKKTGCNGTLEVDVSSEDFGSGAELPPGFAVAFAHPANENFGYCAPLEYYGSPDAAAALEDYKVRAAMKEPYVAPMCLLRMTYKLSSVREVVMDRGATDDGGLTLHLGRLGSHVYPNLTVYDILSAPKSKIALIHRGTERFGTGTTAFVSAPSDIPKSMKHCESQDHDNGFNDMVAASGNSRIQMRGTSVQPRLKFSVFCDGTDESHAAFDFAQCFVRPTCDLQTCLMYVDPEAGVEGVNASNKQLLSYQPEQSFVDIFRESVVVRDKTSPQGMFITFNHMFLQNIAIMGCVDMAVLNAIRIPTLVVKGVERLPALAVEEEADDYAEGDDGKRMSDAFVAAQHVDDTFDTDRKVFEGKGSMYQRLPPRKVAFVTKGRNTDMSIQHITLLNKMLRKGTDQIYIFACMPYENRNRKGSATASRQVERRKLVAEVRKMESVCNSLEMYPIIVDIVAPQLADCVKHFEKQGIDMACINASFSNEEESTALSDEANYFVVNSPVPVFVYKQYRIPDATEDEKGYYLGRVLPTFEGAKPDSSNAAFK